MTMDGTPHPSQPLPWFARPQARTWACAVPRQVSSGAVLAFHASLPGYAPTPLTEVPALAEELGAGRVFVKDESSRLGLPAFKVLGASWAVHQLLTGSPAGEPTGPAPPDGLAGLRELAAGRPGLIFVTATDGNHGRAVARMARLTGAPARVFVPAVTGAATRAAIASEGAGVIQVPGSYDDAVATARQWARDHPATALVQDTAWPGYEQVPAWIVEGYSTLFAELGTQLTDVGAPALVAVPVGVGSLAQAAVAHFRARGSQGDVPAEGWLRRGQNSAPKQPSSVTAVLSVEPDTAACLLASLRAGRPVTVPTANTIMAGLNCGTVSSIAWPYFSAGLDAAIAVTDNAARRAAADLAAAGISSGPSGAASLAGVRAALTGPGNADRRESLTVTPDSVLVLLSTEAGSAG
jgi:diaminopropionate ammonia-lyase